MSGHVKGSVVIYFCKLDEIFPPNDIDVNNFVTQVRSL